MSKTLIIPIDGSTISLKPLDWLLTNLDDWKIPPTVHLLNVQPALPNDISRFVSTEQLRDYHREEGLKSLAAAGQRLKDAGLAPQLHVSIGESAETIVEFAGKLHCDMILIGTRGHTGLGGTLLGSVASKVAHLSSTPLLLVR
jgi:nucleotide-binding universal stress UspA family protein